VGLAAAVTGAHGPGGGTTVTTRLPLAGHDERTMSRL
jgi:hypothetical protein